MARRATIRAEFGSKHRDYIQRAVRSTVSVAEGAVRAGKTIDNITAFAYLLEKGVPDRIHLVTGSTVGTAKLNVGDANGFGLEHIFRGRCRWTNYKNNEALIVTVRGREYVVIFAGGAKADSYKRIRGNSYGMWLATEINLHHEEMVREAFNRQLAAKVRRVFWDLNPINPNAWIYREWIDRFPETFAGRYNYEHFTIRDNATIPPERIAEIELQYVPGSIWYRRDIEGERCAAEGLVYPMYAEAVEDTYAGPRLDYVISVDYGTMNPFAALKWAKGDDGAWHLIDEFYYSGRTEGHQKTDADYVRDMVAFTSDAPANRDIRVIVDPSATSFIAALRRCTERRFKTVQAENDVLAGIEDTATCLQASQGLIRIGRGCKDTLAEFASYVWDDRSDSDRPVKEHDHAMDAMRYFVRTMHVYRPQGVYIPLIG